jgi:hypothetical protein
MAIDTNPGTPLRAIASYTASGNFTVPAGTTRAFVSIHSATGGGGGRNAGARYSGNNDGSSAGAGIVSGAWVQVSPGSTYAVVVGAGGAAGTTGDGSNGGISSFDGSSFSVTGSGGGFVSSNTTGGASVASGQTSLSSLNPSSATIGRTGTIANQSTGKLTSGVGGGGANRYNALRGPSPTAGESAQVYIYI